MARVPHAVGGVPDAEQAPRRLGQPVRRPRRPADTFVGGQMQQATSFGEVGLFSAVLTKFLKLTAITTAERDALNAENGMVIYNSTTNKFQGYENGAWADLI